MPYVNDLFAHTNYALAQEVARLLLQANVIGIAAHANPDADALGSTLALAHGLQSLGKKVLLFNASPIPAYLAWMPFTGPLYTKMPQDSPEPDLIVVLDCGDAARLGDIESMVLRYPTINIDHHLDNPLFGSECNWSAPSMAATGQMVAAVLHALHVPLQGAIAVSLYMALSSDTGNLTYGNTTEDVFLLCAHLMREGLNLVAVRQQSDNTWKLRRMHLWGEIMHNVRLEHNNTVALAAVSREMLTKHQCSKDDLEGLSEHLRRLQGVVVAGFIREDGPYLCKASLRSSGPIDVRQMASTLGGGGHRNAAGATLHFDLNTSKEKIYASVTKWLDAHPL